MEPLECARHRGDGKNSNMKVISNLIPSTYQVPSTLLHCPHFTEENTGSEESENLPVVPEPVSGLLGFKPRPLTPKSKRLSFSLNQPSH